MKNGYFAVFASLMLAAPAVRASTITVSLNQSAQNYLLTGTGDDGYGDGTYINTQGACVASAGSTSCSLSGTYTGSTPGFTGGTYDFVTSYPGTGPSGLTSYSDGSTPPNNDYFFLNFIPAGTTMTLFLDDNSGNDYTESIYNNGTFGDAGYSVSFVNAVCTGVAVCSQYEVGETPGATESGVVTGSATFDAPVAAATPEPGFLALGSIPGMLIMMRRKLSARKA